MHLTDCAWLILFLPLLSAVVITLFTRRDARLSAQLSIGAVAVSFCLGLVLFIAMGDLLRAGKAVESTPFVWLDAGKLIIEFGLRLDALSLLMVLVVTGVGGAIHVYSYGYMSGDES